MGICFILGIGYLGLSAYILYQAVMLDKYRRWNQELMRELAYLQPPF